MNTPDPGWQLKTITGAAAQLAVSKSTLRRLIQAGVLTTVRVGGRRLVDSRDLEIFVAAGKSRGVTR
jgi:excisionase family DNA binding protein